VPVQPFPSHVARDRQAAPPRLEARPPDHEPTDRQDEQGGASAGIHEPAGRSGEQIVVEVEQGGDEPDAGWDGFADIGARPRIEQPGLQVIAAPQADFYGLVGIGWMTDAHDPVPRVDARRGRLEFGVRQPWLGAFREEWRNRGGAV
jgi:hypothetical protein